MDYRNQVANFRKEYQKSALEYDLLEKNPYKQFENWFKVAVNSPILEANVMILSTILDGQPSSRVVLLKGFNEQGFMFYTNYDSNKGQAIAKSNKVSLLFYWDVLEQQIRIEGVAKKCSNQQSDKYFAGRPKQSQIAAWVSNQSQPVTSRNDFESWKVKLEKMYATSETVPRPENWGGYIVEPNMFEFWQGRENRLHDRFQYKFVDKKWIIQRLAP